MKRGSARSMRQRVGRTGLFLAFPQAQAGDRTILVRITDDGESGRIKVRSENEKGDHRRFLTIDFSSETVDGKRILTVEDISSVPF